MTPWWLCFVSFTSLGLTQAGIKFTAIGGTLAPALFLATWFAAAAARPGRAVAQLARCKLLYALPLLAMASSLWSTAPAHSLRTGAEFLLTLAAANLAAQATPPAAYVSANMLAVLLQVLVSLAGGLRGALVQAGSQALTGLFGSKNYMGYVGALLGLLCLAVAADRAQPRLLRAIAAAGLPVGVTAVLLARSADAMLAFATALAALGFVLLLTRLSPRPRVVLTAGAALVLLAATALGLALHQDVLQAVLALTGKDASLTGRTYLWDHARMLIGMRPLAGWGYGAFWTQGNPDAEALWRHFQIHERAGFSFHNMYYQISVDCGALGAALWLGAFAVTLVATLVAALRRPTPPLAFFLAFLIFTAMRLPVETELLGPFDIAPIWLAAALVYAGASRYRGVIPSARSRAGSSSQPGRSLTLRNR